MVNLETLKMHKINENNVAKVAYISERYAEALAKENISFTEFVRQALKETFDEPKKK